MSAPSKTLVAAEQTLAQWAADYPEVVEERPWGHRAFKVRGKTFMFLTLEDGTLGFSLKLPQSGLEVLGLPFAEPTGYGLGKSGWVSCSFDAKDAVPLELVGEWLRESFVAIAPKKLSQALVGSAASTELPKTAPKKPAPKQAGKERDPNQPASKAATRRVKAKVAKKKPTARKKSATR